jgi:lipopolysaccharide/colanic/teichoic acid biosynthesis glycosyltransferase
VGTPVRTLQTPTPLELRYRARGAVGPRWLVDNEWACRSLNVAVASLALLLSAPLMAVIATLIKLTSRGPVVFRQQRIGLDRRSRRQEGSLRCRRNRDHGGRLFTIFKFRTMREEAVSRGEVWASKDDDRITPLGRVLRATRLDELPQCVNVLKGDMNIVGPRPEQPTIFLRLDEAVEEYRDRQRVLPGITGLAQVELGYDTDIDGVRRKVELDLEYIRRRSPSRDLMIMAKTVPVILFQKVWR